MGNKRAYTIWRLLLAGAFFGVAAGCETTYSDDDGSATNAGVGDDGAAGDGDGDGDEDGDAGVVPGGDGDGAPGDGDGDAPNEGAADDGGGDGGGAGDGDGDGDDPTIEPAVYGRLPSKGGSMATDEAGRTLAVANRGTDSVTLFDITGKTTIEERVRFDVGDEPVSVNFSPDGKWLYVLNRASATVSVVSGADGGAPQVTETIEVGHEPGLAALSPTGRTLYVTSWSDGTLQTIDTKTYQIRSRLYLGGAPYAVCVTNDADADDTDEKIFVTDFYSRPLANKKEGTDGSRRARVFRVDAAAPDQLAGVTYLDPILVKGIEPGIDAAKTEAFANQLHACVVHQDYLFVTATGASPAAFDETTDFRQNVHGLMYGIELSGSYGVVPKWAINLSELIAALPGEKRFAAVPNDIAFVEDTMFGYISVQSANMVLRVDLSQDTPVAGAPSGTNFLPTDKSPSGLAIFGTTNYTNNEVGRSVSIIELPTQKTIELSIPSAPLPQAGTVEAEVLKGQQFFNTGLARWSTGAWVSCASCHPNGLTDNVTWVFPAGPRQTVDTSATYNRDGSVQRILNWTGIFDEVHDFELNTRGVANGVGAIVTDPALDVANRIDFVGPGGVGDPRNGFNEGSVKGVQDDQGVLDDWDLIDLYVQTLRTPRGASYHVEGDPQAGRDIFEEARCYNCHGGPLWTLSERYYTPELDRNLRFSFETAGIAGLGDVRPDHTVIDDKGFDVANLVEADGNGPPLRHACVVRDVDTFGQAGPDARGADEIRQNEGNAQGVDGFNVPSLLGINQGAPYLHNGAAESLEALLDPKGDFVAHLLAGNQVFNPTEQQVADLVAFLKSIDGSTPTYQVPAGHQLCPQGVKPQPRVVAEAK